MYRYFLFLLLSLLPSFFQVELAIAQLESSPKDSNGQKVLLYLDLPSKGSDDYSYSYTEEDNKILNRIIDSAEKMHLSQLPIGKRINSIGQMLLGTPYQDKTLEGNGKGEGLIINLRGLDCVTFFENSWAFARMLKKYTKGNLSYLNAELHGLRYRYGIINGYPSRLHYTSDYFYNNSLRGNLKEMTKEIGGSYAILEKKPINFMTTHPNLYSHLKDSPETIAAMDTIENCINSRGGFYYIKKENVEKIESGIETGDILGITTSIVGIDCSHTGIAVRGDDGRIHFMHASSAMHKVIITEIPLADYLANNSKQTGIMIYRPQEVK
jgi:hypothetical protein